MQQSLIINPSTIQKNLPSKAKTLQTTNTQFTFNISNIDELFPGFKTGDFAVLYGPQTLTSLASLLCVRAQLPTQMGGLESDVVFIDCASSSSLSKIGDMAQNQQLNATAALEAIHNIRVYSAYRLTSVIMEKLQQTVESCDAKLVVLSDIANPFLQENVNDQEAKAVYGQLMSYLANFAKKHHIIIIATYLPHEGTTRNSFLQEITSAKANTVLRFTKTPYTKEVELEKHPSYILGVADLTSENQVLTDFTGGATNRSNYFLM
ncbi:MAG: hypothetical protein NWF01_01015 [Candidatus Bathyarchaeota archaeon]|nr:hypothetical protein [Candidatus Bathyarchaeota archaeon]